MVYPQVNVVHFLALTFLFLFNCLSLHLALSGTTHCTLYPCPTHYDIQQALPYGIERITSFFLLQLIPTLLMYHSFTHYSTHFCGYDFKGYQARLRVCESLRLLFFLISTVPNITIGFLVLGSPSYLVAMLATACIKGGHEYANYCREMERQKARQSAIYYGDT